MDPKKSSCNEQFAETEMTFYRFSKFSWAYLEIIEQSRGNIGKDFFP